MQRQLEHLFHLVLKGSGPDSGSFSSVEDQQVSVGAHMNGGFLKSCKLDVQQCLNVCEPFRIFYISA